MGRPRSPESSSSRTTKGSKKHSSHREKHRGPEIYYTEPLTYQQQPLPQMPQMSMPMPQPNMNMNIPPQPSQVYLSSSSSSSSSFEIIDISRTFPVNRSGIKTFFTTPSEHKQRRRLRRRSSSKRLFKFGNSSSSSVNSDLAYGTGYLKRPKRKGVRSRKGKEIDREDARYRYSDREGRARGSDREEGKRRSRGSTNAEILAVGAGLAALAREQNKADLKAARNGKGPEAVGIKDTHRFDGSTSRGLGNSKISHGSDTFDEDGWESASDDESDGSVDSRLAFGGSGFFGSTRHKPLSRKNTIVDPRLFGPENSLRPYVDEPVGFGQVTWSSTDDFGQQYRTDSVAVGPNDSFSGSQSQVSLQQVFPQPTSDPSRFDAIRNSAASGMEPVYRARPDPVPIQQPQPYTPVSQSIYEPMYSTAPSEKHTPGPGRSTSVAQAALAGVAGAAVGAAIVSSRKDEKPQRDDERKEEHRREDERRRRRELEEERLREEDRLRRRESEKREGQDDRRREKRESPDRDDRKERRRDKDRKDESRGSSDEKRKEKRREKRREDSRDETRDAKREKRREERRSERSEVAPRADPRYEERRTKSEAAVSTVSSIDPFMFQVKEDAFSTPTAELSQGHRRIDSVPKVVTVEREPDFARKRSSSIKDKPASSKSDYFDEYSQYDNRDRDRYREKDREMHDAEAIARETQHSTAPIAVAAIGAAVAVVTASSMRTSKSEKRRAERRNGQGSDYDDRDREYESRGREPTKAQERDPIDQKIQEDADRAYREIVMARKIASQIRSRSNSPDGSVVDKYEHRDDEEEIVRIDTPPELKHEKEKVKGPYDAPNADFRPDYEFEHPKHVENFSLPAIAYDRCNPDMGFLKRDPDADRPRPLLNLVRPTPVPSPLPENQVSRLESKRSDPSRSESGRSESAHSEPGRKSRDHDEPSRTSASDVVIGPRGNVVVSPTASTVSKAVTWGENETKHFDVESPSDHRDEYISSSDIPEPPKRETKATGSKGWGAIVAGVVGAAAVSSSDSSKKSKGKENEKSNDAPYEYRDVIVEPESPPPSQRRRRSPPSPGPKPTVSQSPPPSYMPGSFGDDLDFTATVAAGLQDTGFDPDIVIDDPGFRRRNSPPGSHNLGSYQAPFAETVSDLGQIPVNPSIMSGASQGFIMGEVDATPKDWRSISPDLEGTPTKLSKKEQKKRDREAKRRSVDSTPLESSSTPKEDIPEPEPYFEPKLSKKEQKKRDKEAKRQSNLVEDTMPIVEPTVTREIVEEPESYFEPAKKSKKKSKRDSATLDDTVDASSPGASYDSRIVSVPVSAFDDLRNKEDELNEPKKSKKKSNQDSESFDSPMRSAPPSEIVERERSSSRKSKRDGEILDSPSRPAHPSEIVDRERSSSRKSYDKYKDNDRYERDPRDVSLPPSTPSETSRDGDYEESRKSRKSSMRDTSIFDARDRGDSRSVVSEAASRYDDEPRKSKKKSRSSTRDDDDTRSVASAPVGDEESRRSRKKEKEKEKKGGFLGLFSSKSDVGAREESSKESRDDFEDVKKKKKSKRSSMPDASSLYGDLGSVSVGDLSRSVSNGHSSRKYADDIDDGVRSDGERERKKSRSRAGSSSSKKDSFLGNAGTLGAGVGLAGAAVAIAAQQHQQEKATAEAYEEASSPQNRRERRDRSSRRANVFDYEIMEREIRPSIDPQYGDLLPLPPSEPDTDIESLDDLPGLPESRPTTPEAERLTREKTRSSMRRSLQETPVKSPSQSAVPLKFIMGNRSDRSGPSSPGLPRSSPMQSPIVPDFQSPMFPRTRQNRPKSFESKEYRPLYLVESSRRESNVHVDDDSQLPALPLSQASSRSSSQLEFEDLAKIRDDKEQLSIDIEHLSEEHHSGLLDSQQSTPKAAVFPHDITLEKEPESVEAFSISKSISRRSSPALEKDKQSLTDAATIATGSVALATTFGMVTSPTREQTAKDFDALTSTEQQLAPIEPMTKDMSSYLLQSSPMSRQDDLGSEDPPEVSPSRRKPSCADVDSLHSIGERELGNPVQERKRGLEDFSGEQQNDTAELVGEFPLLKTKKDRKKDKESKDLSSSSIQEDFTVPEASSEAIPKLPIVVAPEIKEEFSIPKPKKDKKKDKKKGKPASSWDPEEEQKTLELAGETIQDFPEFSSAPTEIEPFGETAPSKKGKRKDKKGKSKVTWEPEEEGVHQIPEESLLEPSPEIVKEPSTLAEPEPFQDVPTSKKGKKKDRKAKAKTSWEPEKDTAPQEPESPAPEPLETSCEMVEAELEPPEPEIVEDFTSSKSKKDRKKDKKKNKSLEFFEPELQESSGDLENTPFETQNLPQDPAGELATPTEPEIPSDQFPTKSKKDKKKDKKKGKFASSFEPEEPAPSAPAHLEEKIMETVREDFTTLETKKSQKQKYQSSISWQPEEEPLPVEEAQPEILQVEQLLQEETAPVNEFAGVESKKSKKKGKKGVSQEPEPEPVPPRDVPAVQIAEPPIEAEPTLAADTPGSDTEDTFHNAVEEHAMIVAPPTPEKHSFQESRKSKKKKGKESAIYEPEPEQKETYVSMPKETGDILESGSVMPGTENGKGKGKKSQSFVSEDLFTSEQIPENFEDSVETLPAEEAVNTGLDVEHEQFVTANSKKGKKKGKKSQAWAGDPESSQADITDFERAIEPGSLDVTALPESLDEFTMPLSKRGRKKSRKSQAWTDEPEPEQEQIDVVDHELTVESGSADAAPIAETPDAITLPSSKKGKKGKKLQAWSDEPEQVIAPETARMIEEAAPAPETPDEAIISASRKGKKKNRKSRAFDSDEIPNDSTPLPEVNTGEVSHIFEGKEELLSTSTILPAVVPASFPEHEFGKRSSSKDRSVDQVDEKSLDLDIKPTPDGFATGYKEDQLELARQLKEEFGSNKKGKKDKKKRQSLPTTPNFETSRSRTIEDEFQHSTRSLSAGPTTERDGLTVGYKEDQLELARQLKAEFEKGSSKKSKRDKKKRSESAGPSTWDDTPIDSYQEEPTPREIADSVPKADYGVESQTGDGLAAGYQEDQLSLARQLQAEFGAGSKKSKKDKKRRSTSQTPRDNDPRENHLDISQPVISDEPGHIDSSVAPDLGTTRDGLAAGYNADQLELARQLKEEFGTSSKKSKKDKKRRGTSQTPLGEESRTNYFDESQSFTIEEPQREGISQIAESGTEGAPGGLVLGDKEDQLDLAQQLKEEFSGNSKTDRKGKERESLSRTRAEDDLSPNLPSQEQELVEVVEASFDIPITAEAEEEFAPVGKKSKKNKKGKKRESLLRTTTDDNLSSDALPPDDTQDREIEPEVSVSQPEPDIVEADFVSTGKKSKKDKKDKKRESLLRNTVDDPPSNPSRPEVIQATERELPVAQVDEPLSIADSKDEFGFSTEKPRKVKTEKRESLFQSMIEDAAKTSESDIIQESEAGPAVTTPSLEESIPGVREAAPDDEFAFMPKKSKKDKKNKMRETLPRGTVTQTPEAFQPDFMEQRNSEPKTTAPSVEDPALALPDAIAEDEFTFAPKNHRKDNESKTHESLLRGIADDTLEASASEPVQEQEIKSEIPTPHPDEPVTENLDDDFGFVSKNSKDKKSKKRESLLRSTIDDKYSLVADRDTPSDTTDAQPGEKQEASAPIAESSLRSEPTLMVGGPLSEVVDDFEFMAKKSKKDKKGKKRESLLQSTADDSLAAKDISNDIENVQDVESHGVDSTNINDALTLETKDEAPTPEIQTSQDDSEFTLKRTNSKKDRKAKKRQSLLDNTIKEILPVNVASSAEVQQTRELEFSQQPEVAQEPAILQVEAGFEAFSTKESKDRKSKNQANLLPNTALADQSLTPTSEPQRNVDTSVPEAVTQLHDVNPDSPSEIAIIGTQAIEPPRESPSEPTIKEGEEFEFSLKRSKKNKGKKRESPVPALLNDEILSGGASKAANGMENPKDVEQNETTAATTEIASAVSDNEFSFPVKKSKKEKRSKKREDSAFSSGDPTSQSTSKENIEPDEPEVPTVEEFLPDLTEQAETHTENDFNFSPEMPKDKKSKKREGSVPAAEEVPYESTSNVIDATEIFDTPANDSISTPKEPTSTPVDDNLTMKKGKSREHSIPSTESPLESTSNVINEPGMPESIQVDSPTPVVYEPAPAVTDDDFFPSKKDKKVKKHNSLISASDLESIPESGSKELGISEKAEVSPSNDITFNDPPIFPEDELLYSSKKSKKDKRHQNKIKQDNVAAPEDSKTTSPPALVDGELSSVYAASLEPATEVTDNFVSTSSKKSKKDKKKRQSLLALNDALVEEDLGYTSSSTPADEKPSSVSATLPEPAFSTPDDFTTSKKSKKDKKKRGSLLQSSTFDEPPGEQPTSHQEVIEQVTEPLAVNVANDDFEVPPKGSQKDKEKPQSIQGEYSVPLEMSPNQELSISEPVTQEQGTIIPESEIPRDAEVDNQPSKEEANFIESLGKPKEVRDYESVEFTSMKKSKKDKKKGKASLKVNSAEASGISTSLETFSEPVLELTEPLEPIENVSSESLVAEKAQPASTPFNSESTDVWDVSDAKKIKKDKKKRKGLPVDAKDLPLAGTSENFPEPALIKTTESSAIIDNTREFPLEIETPTEKVVQEPEQDGWAILTKKSKNDMKQHQSGHSMPINASDEPKPFNDSTTSKETDLIPPEVSEEPIAVKDMTRNESDPALEPTDGEWSFSKKSKKDKKKRKSGLSTPFEELPDQTKKIGLADSSSSTSKNLVEPIVGEASQEPALDDQAPITKKSKKDKKKSKSGLATPIETASEPGKNVEQFEPIASTIIEKELFEEPAQIDEQPSINVHVPVQEVIAEDELAPMSKRSKKDKKRKSGISALIETFEGQAHTPKTEATQTPSTIVAKDLVEEPTTVENTPVPLAEEPIQAVVRDKWDSSPSNKSKKNKSNHLSDVSSPMEEVLESSAVPRESLEELTITRPSGDIVEDFQEMKEASVAPVGGDWTSKSSKKSKKEKKNRKSDISSPIGDVLGPSTSITPAIGEPNPLQPPGNVIGESFEVEHAPQEPLADDWIQPSKKPNEDKNRKSSISSPEGMTGLSKLVDPPFEEPVPEPVPFQPSEDVIGRSFEHGNAPQKPEPTQLALPSSEKSKKDDNKSGLSEKVSEPDILAKDPTDMDSSTLSPKDIIEESLPWSEPTQEPAEDEWAPISSKKLKKDKKKRKSGLTTPLEAGPEARVLVEEPIPTNLSKNIVQETTSTETPTEGDWAAIPSKKSKKDKKMAKSKISIPIEEYPKKSLGIEETIEPPLSSLPSDQITSDKPVEDDWAPIPSKKSKKDKKGESSTSTPIKELIDITRPSDEEIPKSEPSILPEATSHEPLIVEKSQATSHESPYKPLESKENSTALSPTLSTSGDALVKHTEDKSTVESSSIESKAPAAHPLGPVIKEQAGLISENPTSHEPVQVPEASFKNIVTADEVENTSSTPSAIELAREPLGNPIEEFGSYSIKKSKKDKKKHKSGLSTSAEDTVAPQYNTVETVQETIEKVPIIGESSFSPSAKDIITPVTLDEQPQSIEITQEPEDEWAAPFSKKPKKDKKKQKSSTSTPKEPPKKEATVGSLSTFQQADKAILEDSAQPIYAEPAEIETFNKEPIVEVVDEKEPKAFDGGFEFSSKKSKKDKKKKKGSHGASISNIKEVSPKTSVMPVESGNVDREILEGEGRKEEVESSFIDKGSDVEIKESEGFYDNISRRGSKKDKRKRQATTDANAAEGIESNAPITSWADEVEEAEVERKLPVIELIGKDDSLAHIAKTTESSPVDDFVRPTKKGRKGKKTQSSPLQSPSLPRSSSSPTKDELPKGTEKTTAAVALGIGTELAGAALLNHSDDKKDELVSSSKGEENPIPTRKLSKKEKRKMSIDKRTPTNDIFDDDVLWEGKDPKEFQEEEPQDDNGDDGFGFWSEPKEEKPQKEVSTERSIQDDGLVQAKEPTLQAQISPVTTMPGRGPISPPQSPDFMQHTSQPSSSEPPNLFADQPQAHVASVQQTPPVTRQHTSSPTHDDVLQTDKSPDWTESSIDRNLFRSSSRFGTRGFSDLPVVEEEPPMQPELLSRPRDFEEINRDSAFVAESPVTKQGAFANNHDHVRDSGVHLRDSSPPEHVSAPISSSDAAIARLSWPSVDEQSETVDLHKSQRPKVETPVKRHLEDKSERRGSPIPTEQVNEFFRAQRSHDTPSKPHRDIPSVETLPSQKERDPHRSTTIHQSSHKHHDEGPAAQDLLPKKKLKEDLAVERQSPIIHKLTEERPVLRHVERTPKAIPSSQRSDESSRDLSQTETLGGHSSHTNKTSLVKQRLAKFESSEVHQSVRPRDISSTIKQDTQRPQTPEQSSRPKKQESYSELKESQRPQAERPKPLDGNVVATGVALAGAAGLGFAAARQLSQEKRPSSATSQRSISNINRLRTPDPKMVVRPESVNSNRSGTPPLRRTDRKISGDLRSLSQRSQVDLAKEAELAAITSAAAVNTPPVSTANPTANEGRVRSKDMADVYDGFGEGRMGSPRSPTRPHSMRRRQSMQVLDLESKVEQLAAENRMLAEARAQAERTLQSSQQNSSALVEREAEIDALKRTLDWLQNEVTRLTEVNEGLASANVTLGNQQNERYKILETEHANTARELQETRDAHTNLSSGMEGIVVAQVRTAVQEKDQEMAQLRAQLESARDAHTNLSSGMEGIVVAQVRTAVQEKDQEIAQLRAQLESAKEKIREMQNQILASKANDIDFLTTRDEDYFDNACQQLCQHVQQWVLRFSKFSDMRACRLTNEINNDKTIDRLDNAILDGADVDGYLSDRVKRRDVFMSMTMTMIWEFIFTRYLFGMDREQRQKLKSLEKLLSEVGPVAAVHQWRATTLTLLSKRTAFVQQREQDTEAVVHAIMGTLSEILPPPSNLETQIEEQLKRVVNAAVNLSIEMRTQRAGYMMLPPLQPEYDANGDLASKVSFNAALMNERSGDTISNEDLEANNAVVRIVLFPLVVKKGDDRGEGDEEIVVCPAQVLVAKPKKSVRLVGPDDTAHPNTSRMSMQSSMPADYGVSPRASRGSVV
ncbi:hypothetical protein BGZ60DRAFT_520920 [Tricladium varicosporioides]|nr:hypothetical protein BGZ60DRAFT_520920 [Hymenoscyphus varicosporioides]